MNSDDHYGWLTGLAHDGCQLLCSDLGIIVFDSTGLFLRIQDLLKGDDWRVEAHSLLATPSAIHVQAFDLPDRGIGVRSLPSSYEEFLRSPTAFSDEDRSEYPAWIDSWKEEGLFVFLLGDDFWMIPNGTVNSH